MSNYKKTAWKDSIETEITAEKLNNMEDGIETLYNERSHVGMIIQSTTLDTMEKVINLYGGTKWEKLEGLFLLGASSTHAVGETGGEETHILTVDEMPSHNHAFTNNVIDGADMSGNTNRFVLCIGGGDNLSGYNIIDNQGGNQSHNNMPPYKAVYIWERVA